MAADAFSFGLYATMATVALTIIARCILRWRGSRDTRTIAEKNWDWIMGPELPSTCAQVGHSHVIDPHICDWCGEKRYIEHRATVDGPRFCLQGVRCAGPLLLARQMREINFEVEDDQPCFIWSGPEVEAFQLVGSSERIVVFPADTMVFARDGQSVGTAGRVLDGPSAVMRESKDEARQEAKEQATRAAKRGRAVERYQARRDAQQAAYPAFRRKAPGNPGGYAVIEPAEEIIRSINKTRLTHAEARKLLKELQSNGMETERSRWQ